MAPVVEISHDTGLKSQPSFERHGEYLRDMGSNEERAWASCLGGERREREKERVRERERERESETGREEKLRTALGP